VTERHADWLTLLRAPGVGPVTAGRLLSRFGGPGEVLAAGRPALESEGLTRAALEWLEQPDSETLQRDLDWLEAPNHYLLTLADPDYPPLLRAIPDPPPALFVVGRPGLLGQPQLAIVGSRNPTPGGRRNARDFASCLAGNGLGVCSGMAVGIDTAAHEGALETGLTIAVAGTGLDRIYPASNRELAHRIALRGALVSELPIGSGAKREHFPRRNRIISGMSVGTLVVEAAARSGSLITARLAAEQGREVFAIPGSIHNPLARGCHALIRQGAKLVESAHDIVEELGPLLQTLDGKSGRDAAPKNDETAKVPDPEYAELLACMGHDPVSVDALIACSGLASDVISSMLLLLELQGHVTPVPGGRYCRIAKA
jgi:DNA processing protein